MPVRRELGPHVLRALDAGREHAGLVGELELDASIPDRVEPHAQLVPAALGRHRDVIGAQVVVAQQRGVEDAVHGRAVLAPVLDELGVGLHLQPVEQRERRRSHQLREPAVKGADLDRPAGGEHARLQSAELGRERLGPRRLDAALDERTHALLVGRARRRELGEPLVEPLAHLARSRARERDREDLVRRGAVEQRPQHARHQHPRLA